MTRTLFLAASIAALATLAPPAAAQSDVFTPGDQGYQPERPNIIVEQVPVNLSNVDIDSRRGARVALNRIDRAAKAACGGSPQFDSMYSVAPIYVTRQFDLCREHADTRAVERLQSPEVSRLYDRGYHARIASLVPPE
ncbi:MAG: UrcA family protein [Alphaproteobacteria bacterium]|nr:UrcA family protein [Alphaproteobacteria bacterium]